MNHNRQRPTFGQPPRPDTPGNAQLSEPPPEAFTHELAGLRPHLSSRAMALLQNVAAADDLVQDTLERALANRGSFRGGTNLRAWTTSIMRNLFIDGWRRTALYVHVDPDELGSVAQDQAAIGPADLLGTADVSAALVALPAREREVFELAYFQHADYRTLAKRFGIKKSTVGTRLFRAKAKLRLTLEGSYLNRLRELRG
jgi:RNA polymerase sigma factor (sigma-70 family)